FQAEDGIRDRNVTGVQTCALPSSDLPGREVFQPVFRRLSVTVFLQISNDNIHAPFLFFPGCSQHRPGLTGSGSIAEKDLQLSASQQLPFFHHASSLSFFSVLFLLFFTTA